MIKKYIHYLLLIVLIFIVLTPTVLASGSDDNHWICPDGYTLKDSDETCIKENEPSLIYGSLQCNDSKQTLKDGKCLSIIPAYYYENLCSTNEGVQNAVRIIGYVVAIIKWVAPLMIIVFGILDFSKAVVSSDENALNKATKSLARRLISGVIIFFIPTIITAILNVLEYANIIHDSAFESCTKCILKVSDCDK